MAKTNGGLTDEEIAAMEAPSQPLGGGISDDEMAAMESGGTPESQGLSDDEMMAMAGQPQQMVQTAAVPQQSQSWAMPGLGDIAEEYKAAGLAAARLPVNVAAGISGFGNTVTANLLELLPFQMAQDAAGTLRQSVGDVQDFKNQINRDYLTPRVVADPLSEMGGTIAAGAVPTTVAMMAGAPALAVGGIGAATGLGQGFTTAKDFGATDEQAALSGAANALINTSDALLPVGKVASPVRSMLGAAFKGGAVNATQEALSNLEAAYLSRYDPNRGVFENVPQAAAIGVGMGAAGNLPRLAAQAGQQPRPAETTIEAPPLRPTNTPPVDTAVPPPTIEPPPMAPEQAAAVRNVRQTGEPVPVEQPVARPVAEPTPEPTPPMWTLPEASTPPQRPAAQAEPAPAPPMAVEPPPVRPAAAVEPEPVQTPRTPQERPTTPEKPPAPPPQRTEMATPSGSTPPPASGEGVTQPDHHVAEYGGKRVVVDYASDPKREFAVAAQRVRDNLKSGETGYVTSPDGKRYEISTNSKKAKLVSTAPEAAPAPKPAEPVVAKSPDTPNPILARIDAAEKMDPIKGKVELRRIAKEMGVPVGQDALSVTAQKLRAKVQGDDPDAMQLRSGIPVDEVIRGGVAVGKAIVKPVGKLIAKAGRFAAEPTVDRLSREGGTEAKSLATQLRTVEDTTKKFRGDMSPIVDAGVNAVRQASKATTWMNGIQDKGDYGLSNAQLAAEGKVAVPSFAKAAVDAFNDANLKIGQWAEKYFPNFIASGKFQRNWTREGVEAIRMGRGDMYDKMVKAYAAENGKTPEVIKGYFASMKEAMDSPGGDATWRRINQEFSREFPNAPTHVKINGEWREVIHARPADYLQQSAKRIAARAAVKTVLGDDLSGIRKKVVAELPDSTAFDEAMRAANGMPVVQGVRVEPGGAVDTLYRGARSVNQIQRGLQLTTSAINNLPETFIGGAGSQLGYRRALRGAMFLAKGGRDYLERKGAIDRAFYDNSLSLQQKMQTAHRTAINTISKANLSRLFNELQEARDAATMKVLIDDMRAGKLGVGEKKLLPRVIESMEEGTWSRADAERLVAGKGTDAEYDRLLRKSASFFSGGNKSSLESSRFLNNRGWTELLPFQTYGSMMTHRLMRHTKQVAGDVAAVRQGKPGAWGDLAASSLNTAKFIGATGVQGAMAATIRAAIYGGGAMGLSALYNEAKDKTGNPLSGLAFVGGLFVSGMSGPLEMAARPIMQTGGDPTRIADQLANAKVSDLFYVGQTIKDAIDAFNGNNRFKDMDPTERMAAYLKVRAPILRVADTVAGSYGIGNVSPETEGAISAFYKWKRENDPSSGSGGNVKDENRAFRTHMRRVHAALKAGKPPEDIGKELGHAINLKDPAAAASSLRGRRILDGYYVSKKTENEKYQNNKAMLESLYKRVGPKAYKKLVDHDTLLTEWANGISGNRSESMLPFTPPEEKE